MFSVMYLKLYQKRYLFADIDDFYVRNVLRFIHSLVVLAFVINFV